MSAPNESLHTREREAHAFRNPFTLGVVHSPLDASNDARRASFTVVAEHLDGNEVTPLGHTILCAPDGSSNVSSVAVFVRV